MLHLFDFVRFVDAFEAPFEVTQAGIAKAVGIRVRHSSQYLRPLVNEEMATVDTRHILGKPRSRKSYFLTSKGRQWVATQRTALMNGSVPYKMNDGQVEGIPLATIYHKERRGATLLELLHELSSTGVVQEVRQAGTPRIVDFLQEAPTVREFFGRKEELELALQSIPRTPIVTIWGVAGQGKTTLGSRICEVLRGQQSLFWRRVRPWDTTFDLASRLAVFLEACGRGELHSYLTGSEEMNLSRVEELLTADLEGTSTLLVFDDVHVASREATGFLSLLLDVLKPGRGSSVLLLSRSVPAFYSRRDVAVDESVIEIDLKGLDVASAEALLASHGVIGAQALAWIEATGGNPLFLRILAKTGRHEGEEAGQDTLEAYIGEEVEPSLTEEEKNCLQLGSLYEFPVASEGLLLESEDEAILDGLLRKGLLEPAAGARYTLHDLVRSYFRHRLTSTRKRALVNKLAPWALEEARRMAREGSPQDAISLVQNVLSLEGEGERKARALTLLGDFRIQVGNLAGALEAFSSALREEGEPARRAHLRGKTAWVIHHLGQYEEAEREIQRGLDLLPPGPSLEAARLRLTSALLALYRRDFHHAAQELELVGEWLPDLPEGLDLLPDLTKLRGSLELHDPDRRDPLQAYRHFKEAMEAYGSLRPEAESFPILLSLARSSFALGKTQETLTYIDRALDNAPAEARSGGRVRALVEKGRYVSELLGDFELAENLYREAFEVIRKTNAPLRLPWFQRLFADLYRRQGRFEESREALTWFLENREELGGQVTPEVEAEVRGLLARLGVACGTLKEAEEAAEEALRWAHRASSDAARYHAEWARVVVRASQGQLRRAESDFQRLLELPPPWHRHGIVFDSLASEVLRGELLLDYAQFLIWAGRDVEGKEALHEAIKDFEAHGRLPLQQAAQVVLAQLEPTPSGLEEVSPRVHVQDRR